MNPSIGLITKNVLARKAASRSSWRRGVFLLPLALVWFARLEYANAQVDMARVLMNNQAINNDLQYLRAQQYANESRLRAVYSMPPPASSNFAQPYYRPVYRPLLATQQLPITATDFKPTKGRLLPVVLARSVPGVTPKQRANLAAANNQFLDTFERLGRKNNVASSYALLGCLSLEVVKGRPASNSDAQILTNAFNYVLGNNPQFVSLSSKNKQSIYEWNIIEGGCIAFTHAEGIRKKNAQAQQQAREQALTVLKFLGIDTL